MQGERELDGSWCWKSLPFASKERFQTRGVGGGGAWGKKRLLLCDFARRVAGGELLPVWKAACHFHPAGCFDVKPGWKMPSAPFHAAWRTRRRMRGWLLPRRDGFCAALCGETRVAPWIGAWKRGPRKRHAAALARKSPSSARQRRRVFADPGRRGWGATSARPHIKGNHFNSSVAARPFCKINAWCSGGWTSLHQKERGWVSACVGWTFL